MSVVKALGIGAALLVSVSFVSSAQSLSTSGSPPALTVSTATAGSEPLPVSDASTTYSTNALSVLAKKKITGQIDSNMPAGTILSISLAAPSGATSNGAVNLDITARDLVVNISNLIPQTRSITYQFTATVSAGVVSSSRVVTLTLVNYP